MHRMNRIQFLLVCMILPLAALITANAVPSGDSYIAVTSDAAQMKNAQDVCDQLKFPPVRIMDAPASPTLVIGPFQSGAMAFENLQIIKSRFPEAGLIRLEKNEDRITFIAPSISESSVFKSSARLGKAQPPTHASQDFSNYYDSIKALQREQDFLSRIQNMRVSLSDTDPRKGTASKFEADQLYTNAFNNMKSGTGSFDGAKQLYCGIVRGETAAPREMRGHSAIKLIFIAQAENRTEVWCPNPDASNPLAYLKAYQTCRDAYNFLDDERYRPEAAVHMVAKQLELADRFDVGTYKEVRETVRAAKADLPSSDSIRRIAEPILSNREFIVNKYRYNMSTLDLMYAETYYYEKDFERAYESFKALTEEYSDVPRNYIAAMQWRGQMAMALKNDKEAIECFKAVLADRSPITDENAFARRNPRSNCAYWLGQLLLKQGQREETRKLYEEILEKYPQCKEKEHIEQCLKNLAD